MPLRRLTPGTTAFHGEGVSVESLKAFDALEIDDASMHQLQAFSTSLHDDLLCNETSFLLTLRSCLLTMAKVSQHILENRDLMNDDFARCVRTANEEFLAFTGNNARIDLDKLFVDGIGIMHHRIFHGLCAPTEVRDKVAMQANTLMDIVRDVWTSALKKETAEIEAACPPGFDAALDTLLANKAMQKALLENNKFASLGAQCGLLDAIRNSVNVGSTKGAVMVEPEVVKAAKMASMRGCSVVSATFALHKLLTTIMPVANVNARTRHINNLEKLLHGKKGNIGASLKESFISAKTDDGYKELQDVIAQHRSATLGYDSSGPQRPQRLP